MQNSPVPIHVVVALLPQMDATSVSVTVQALETANRLGARVLGRSRPFRVTLGSVDGNPVSCGPGPFQLPTVRLAGLRPDLVVVPGAGADTEAALRDVLASRAAEDLCAWLRRQARRKVAASCTGVFLLAKAGLLDGFAATTTWWLAGTLATLHPRVRVERDAMVVEDSERITAGASLAQLDLMLRLVAREASPALASLVARYLVVDERPSQARYIVPSHLARSSTEVTAAERWVREHLGKPFGIPDLARSVGTSPRTLARRIAEATGSGPLAFVRRIRVDAARHLLATTRLPVDAIAARVGYDDPASLRRAFARFGERPTDARRAHDRSRVATSRPKRRPVRKPRASRRVT
ncbi:helix-turn-helix domain-containing protein [Candidatus Binatia bacterium]|nr:helix-turn-helix domain-containing protein [Candidatus Binatia bacterium]